MDYELVYNITLNTRKRKLYFAKTCVLIKKYANKRRMVTLNEGDGLVKLLVYYRNKNKTRKNKAKTK